MHLQCLQDLLGHSCIEMTHRYARLTDNTRRKPWKSSKGGILMAIIDSILNYRRFLKRRNYSKYTLRNYMSTLRHFALWLDMPIEEVTHKKLLAFIDHLLNKRLKPKTINCYLDGIRGFYDYLIYEEEVAMTNPVKCGYTLRLSRPLSRHLRDEQISKLFDVIHSPRDRIMFN